MTQSTVNSNDKYYVYKEQIRFMSENPEYKARLQATGFFIQITRDKIKGLNDFWQFCLTNSVPLNIIVDVDTRSKTSFKAFLKHIKAKFGSCQCKIKYNTSGQPYNSIILANKTQ